MKTIKNPFRLMARLMLTAGLTAAAAGIIHALEYDSQLGAVDNPVGAAPLLLLLGVAGMLAALIWKRHRNASTSTIVLAVLAALWALLFLPAVDGNWYPLARVADAGSASPDLSVYAPFIPDTRAAALPGKASETIRGELPRLDGATALYPLYAAFANAVYDEAAYSPGEVVCTNTPGAYEALVAGDCDVIFVAGPSAGQRRAAADAGAALTLTPIGREAFVFLTGASNPIDGLTRQQLRNIYSGKTARWKTLGWDGGGRIIAFQRPEGSGSQTGLQSMMGSLPIQKPQPLPDDSLIGSDSMMRQVSVEWQGVQPAIGYSYRYYATAMYANPDAKLLAVDGVYPSNATIADGSYPFASPFYAVTRGEPAGNAKRMVDWILSAEGQYLVEKTGYAPL